MGRYSKYWVMATFAWSKNEPRMIGYSRKLDAAMKRFNEACVARDEPLVGYKDRPVPGTGGKPIYSEVFLVRADSRGFARMAIRHEGELSGTVHEILIQYDAQILKRCKPGSGIPW